MPFYDLPRPSSQVMREPAARARSEWAMFALQWAWDPIGDFATSLATRVQVRAPASHGPMWPSMAHLGFLGLPWPSLVFFDSADVCRLSK